MCGGLGLFANPVTWSFVTRLLLNPDVHLGQGLSLPSNQSDRLLCCDHSYSPGQFSRSAMPRFGVPRCGLRGPSRRGWAAAGPRLTAAHPNRTQPDPKVDPVLPPPPGTFQTVSVTCPSSSSTALAAVAVRTVSAGHTLEVDLLNGCEANCSTKFTAGSAGGAVYLPVIAGQAAAWLRGWWSRHTFPVS